MADETGERRIAGRGEMADETGERRIGGRGKMADETGERRIAGQRKTVKNDERRRIALCWTMNVMKVGFAADGSHLRWIKRITHLGLSLAQ